MPFFQFIIALGVAYIVLYLAMMLLTTALGTALIFLFKIKSYERGYFVLIGGVNGLTLYLTTSLLVVIALYKYQNSSPLGSVMSYLLGALFVFGIIGDNIADKVRNRVYLDEEDYTFRTSVQMKMDMACLLLCVPLYIILFAFPQLALTPPTTGLVFLTQWVWSLPYIGWIVGLFGLLLSIGTIKNGLVYGIGVPLMMLGRRGRSDDAPAVTPTPAEADEQHQLNLFDDRAFWEAQRRREEEAEFDR